MRALVTSPRSTRSSRPTILHLLRFASPLPAFPLVLCELPILPEHLLRDVPRSDMRRAPFNLAPVGNGPFKFVERVAGQRWVFARNDSFPATLGGPPRIAELVIAVVDEPTTKFAGLASGDLDFAPTMAARSHSATRRCACSTIRFSWKPGCCSTRTAHRSMTSACAARSICRSIASES